MAEATFDSKTQIEQDVGASPGWPKGVLVEASLFWSAGGKVDVRFEVELKFRRAVYRRFNKTASHLPLLSLLLSSSTANRDGLIITRRLVINNTTSIPTLVKQERYSAGRRRRRLREKPPNFVD